MKKEKFLILYFFLLLVLPVVYKHVLEKLFVTQNTYLISLENRPHQQVLALPTDYEALKALPSQLNSYINDNFGFRVQVIKAVNRLHFALFRDIPRTKQVVFGQDGYIYLGNHAGGSPLSLMLLGSGIDGKALISEKFASDLAKKAMSLHSNILFASIPTKHSLYPEHFPEFLRKQALNSVNSLASSHEHLQDLSGGRFLYPYRLALELKKRYDVINNKFFHWVPGVYTSAVADLVSLRFGKFALGDKYYNELSKSSVQSDLAGLYVGPDIFGASQLMYAPEFFQRHGVRQEDLPLDFGPEVNRFMKETIIFTSTCTAGSIASDDTLLVMGDSFAIAIAQDLSMRFSRVIHLSTNNFNNLSHDLQLSFMNKLLEFARPTHFLLVGHISVATHFSLFFDNISLIDSFFKHRNVK